MTNLRLSPSGPELGAIALMVLRQDQGAEAGVAVTLTAEAQEINENLRATLTGPFDPSHYLSCEASFDASNESETTAATVSVVVQVSVDGADWVNLTTVTHKIGAQDPGEGQAGNLRIQPIHVHVAPAVLAAWGAPALGAEEIQVRIVALASAGQATKVKVRATAMQWITLVEHSAPAGAGPLRLSPSGEDIGGGLIDLMPLRVAELVDAIADSFALTDTPVDANSALRAVLAGPFDPSHYLSAEVELDVSNRSADTLGVVTVSIQVQVDAGSWTTIHSVDHNVGGDNSEEVPSRQIRTVSCHVPPLALAAWGAPALAAAQIQVRAMVSETADAGDCYVETDNMYIRLTEHAPAADSDAPLLLRLSPSGPDVGETSLLPMRLNEATNTRETALVLTGTPATVATGLQGELVGPFDAGAYLSAECDLDVSNGSTNTLAVVTLTIQSSVNAGVSWSDVYSEVHDVGGNGSDGLRQVRPMTVHVPPLEIADWNVLAADEAVRVRVVASTASADTGTVQVEASEMWLRLTEHSAP
jgi:hypothetical protein